MRNKHLYVVALQALAASYAGCSGGSTQDSLGSESSALPNSDESDSERARRAYQRFPDDHGTFANFTTAGHLDTRNEFFQSLGTNGRACVTCHRPENGFTLDTKTVQRLFDKTDGEDPLFRPVDGANTPNEDVSTVDARRNAYSLLLNRGVIRIGLPMPANAQFTLVSIADPYGFATPDNLSLYRKPLMSSNLKFVVGDQPCVGCTTTPIMWDGREPNLQSQANNATLGHAQALQPLTTAQQDSIVAFETALFTAQDHVRGAGTLIHAGGGGPRALSEQPFAFKMNTVGPLPTPPKSFDAFALFAAFSTSDNELQQSILRGQQIFNRRQLKTTPAGVPVTCTTCHSSINVGGNDFPEPPINQATIGSAGRGPLSPPISDQFLAPDLPVYTFKNNATGAIVQVNDPGAALITGLWNDLGRFKVPNLRGLASHAPYFHNGLAPTLEDVVDFYDVTFAQNFPPGNIAPFSAQEKADLVAFMSAL